MYAMGSVLLQYSLEGSNFGEVEYRFQNTYQCDKGKTDV